MRRLGVKLSVPIVAVALLVSLGSDVLAQVGGGARLVVDLTTEAPPKPKAGGKDSEKLDRAERIEGLAYRRYASGSVLGIETAPVPTGPSWKTMPMARITARIEPPGKYRITDTGEFYARYSPDKKHWSSWQYIPREENDPGQVYRGEFHVPYKEAEEYHRRLSEYSRQDVPWKADEEAAVRWIVAKDPAFFEKSLPFIGYVQFLFEHLPRGAERIHINLGYVYGGTIFSPPKDLRLLENREGPWRFKAE